MTLMTCPKCNGSCRIPATDRNRGCYGFDKATDTLPCSNCGGQRMELRATGSTTVDPATGLGCLHDYKGRNGGNCYTIYTCSKCGDRYDIDSSD